MNELKDPILTIKAPIAWGGAPDQNLTSTAESAHTCTTASLHQLETSDTQAAEAFKSQIEPKAYMLSC